MTSLKRFEQLIVGRAKTLDDIRATIERINYLLEIITQQIKLEQQWSSFSSDIEVSLDIENIEDIENDETLGYEPRVSSDGVWFAVSPWSPIELG